MARNRKWAVAVGVVLFLACSSVQALGAAKSITLAEMEELVKAKPEEGKYLLVDSRPEIKYFAGHLPWAVSLPYQEMEERLDELPADKDVKLVFYCGGLKCDLSSKAADLAVQKGYADVYVFHEGMPAWKKSGKSPWVATSHIKMVLNDRDRVALVVDARPVIKYNAGTVPGAINIPYPEFDKLKGLLPSDKAAQIIFFCGGFKCDLSHKAATKAMEMGYTDVRTYAEGWPVWKKQSTRAFAMVNPKDGASGPVAEEEPMVYEGEISKDDMLKLLAEKPEGFLLVDVRPAEEFAKSHIPGAINILDEKIGENIDQLKAKEKVVFYCSTGSRAAVAYYGAEDAGIKGTLFLNRTVDFKADGSYEIQ